MQQMRSVSKIWISTELVKEGINKNLQELNSIFFFFKKYILTLFAIYMSILIYLVIDRHCNQNMINKLR